MGDDDRIWTNAMVLSARDDEIDALEQKLARADARIAELKCSLNHIAAAFDADQEALTERDARIAELVDLLAECRDCVLDCLNAEQNQWHSRAQRADYYAGLLAQVDAVINMESGDA